MPYADPEKQKEYQDNYAKTPKRKKKIKEYKEKNSDKIKKSNKEYKNKNKKDILAKQAKWYQDNKERICQERKIQKRTIKGRFTTSKQQAKLRKIEFSLSFEEYSNIISNPCAYCQYKLGEPVQTGSGIDRMDNNIGYVDGNCISCCFFCNKVKNDMLTYQEMIDVAKLIIEKRNK